jgi:hypothetical protein
MNPLQRAMSKITLKPSADSELYQTPYVNGDNFVDFRDDDVENGSDTIVEWQHRQ